MKTTVPSKSSIYIVSNSVSIITAGQKLGGCGDGIGCSDSKAPKCDKKDKDWDRDRTGLIGTCIPRSNDFSSLVLGSGKCQKGSLPYNTACDILYTSISNYFITILPHRI